MNNETSFVPQIKEQQWNAYLDVQDSGETNMWDTRAVAYLSGGELDKADVLYCIKHYGELSKYFGYDIRGSVE